MDMFGSESRLFSIFTKFPRSVWGYYDKLGSPRPAIRLGMAFWGAWVSHECSGAHLDPIFDIFPEKKFQIQGLDFLSNNCLTKAQGVFRPLPYSKSTPLNTLEHVGGHLLLDQAPPLNLTRGALT